MADFNNISDEERKKLGCIYLQQLQDFWKTLEEEENFEDKKQVA